jgi:hypothetical protein
MAEISCSSGPRAQDAGFNLRIFAIVLASTDRPTDYGLRCARTHQGWSDPEQQARADCVINNPRNRPRPWTRTAASRPTSAVVVVEATGHDGDHVVLDVVDQPVLLGYPA